MGIFQDQMLYTRYQARIKFRAWCMGATPMNPKAIEGWIKSRAGVDDGGEIRQMMLRTLLELGADVTPEMTFEQLDEAAAVVAANKHTVGFKRDAEHGLYLEARIVKACLKECTNILFAGDRWGKTAKGPKAFLAERVFVDPDRISLGRTAPDDVALIIGHTSGPKGPQSNLTYYEYVDQAECEFVVSVTQDAIRAEHWPLIWNQAENIGLGALRSQSYGRFDILQWDEIKDAKGLHRVA